MKQIIRYLVCVITLIAGVSLFVSTSVSAQQSNSISISPLRQEATIDPGFTYSNSLTIKNTGTESRQIDLSAETFNVTNQAYDYLFKTDTTEAKWVTFDTSSFILKAGESKVVTYQVSVPIGTEPAGYYLALFALNRPEEATVAGISPTPRGGSLLYLTVSGDASRSGQLIRLSTPVVVFASGDWSATLQNSGTLHYQSVYSAKISTLWDRQVSFKEDSRLVLPQSVRLVEGSFPTPEVLGLYKATFTVSLGDTPQHQETRWFLYLPPIQTGLILLIIIGLSVIIRTRRKSS